jgi:hypothetical protein
MRPVDHASSSTGVRTPQAQASREVAGQSSTPAGAPTVREDPRVPPSRSSVEMARLSGGTAEGSFRRSAGPQAPRVSGGDVRLQIDGLARSSRHGSETGVPLRPSGHEGGDGAPLVVPGTPEIVRNPSLSTVSHFDNSSEIRLDIVDTAGGGASHRPLHLEPRGGGQAAEIPDMTNRREYATALSTHSRTPGVTGLQTFARVSSELAASGGRPPHGPQRSRFNVVASAVKRAVGLQDDVTWMSTKMRAIRAAALEAKLPAGAAQPTNALGLLRTGQPVSAVWRSPTLAQGNHFGAEGDALLAHMDQLAAAHSPELALAVSFACRSAHAASPEHEGSLMQALDLLHRTDGAELRALLAHGSANGEPPTPASAMARKILESCCDNNRFEAVVHAMAPGLDGAAVPVLRRMLQAAKAAAAEGSPDGLAARVHQAAVAELAGAAAPPTEGQRVESFLWDNGFHDDGPDSALSELKQHFFAGLEELSKPANQAGPVAAAAAYGLGGANLHLLADEQTKLIGLLRTGQAATPELRALTDGLSARVVEGLNAAQVRLRLGESEPADHELDEIVELAALAVALKRWTGDAVANLSPSDVVHGPVPTMAPNSPDRAAVAQTCMRLMAGEGALRSLDELATPDRTVEVESDRRRLDLARALGNLVEDKLETTRLGLHGLLDAAHRAGVRLPAQTAEKLQDGLGIIQAKSIHPEAATAEATGEAMARFLSNVQFGNHSRLSSIDVVGGSTRGAGANLTPLLHPGDAHAAHSPITVRGDLSADRTVERFVRAGAATHGGEFILGRDARTHGHVGAGSQAGRQWGAKHSVHARLMAGVDATLYSHDSSRYEGAMFRVDRRVTTDVADAENPQFAQSDRDVRATMAEMARELFGNGPQHAATAPDREQFFHQFVDRFMDRDLSLTLMKQDSTSHRSDITGSLGGSISTPLTKKHGFGARLGASVTVGAEKGWGFALNEKDRTGTYRINNVRTGWFTRTKGSVNVGGINPTIESAYGLPATSVAGASATRPDSGGSVRVRVPTRNGNIVPEKAFSDTETPDKEFFKEIVLADKQKWIDLFAYKHRQEGPEEAQRRGEADVDAFFYKADHVHDANHLYYARERLHPDVAARLDDLAGIEHQIPHDDPAFAGLRAEVAGKRERLASDDRSWTAASLIAYQREVKQDGGGLNASGARAMRSKAVEGEREFIFDTIGWANLRQRERDNPPTHLDE